MVINSTRIKIVCFLFVLFILILVPLFEVSAIEPLVPCLGVECQGCHLTQLVQRILNFLVVIAVSVAAIMFAVAGFYYITAGGGEQINKAHKIFTNTLIGAMVVFAAWLIINTIIQVLVGEGLESFGNIECAETVFNPADDPGGIGPALPPQPSEDETIGPPPDSSFTFDPNIREQLSHASAPLQSLLGCMAGILPGNVGRISSISDGVITRGESTFPRCSRQGGCSHTTGSCHYGGTGGCLGSSYAVDFGDSENASTIFAAARTCNPNVFVLNHGPSLHISVGRVSGCGCD